MSFTLDKKESIELRKKLSLDICDNFIRRLKPYQSRETKLGALIAIRNLVKESKISDPILHSFLIDSITDADSEIVDMVNTITKEIIEDPIVKTDIIELLNLKSKEVGSTKIKKDVEKLLEQVMSS